MNKFKVNKNNIPNLLTLFRMVLILPLLIIFPIAWALSININWTSVNIALTSIILVIFIIAMFTDFLDGYLARKWKVVSNFGKLWDPLADKVMTTSVLIFLAWMNIIPFWIVVILVIRDIVVDGARVVMSKNNISIAANLYGKLKTLVLSISIIFVMIMYLSLGNLFINKLYVLLFNIPTLIGLALSLLSGFIYLKTTFKINKTK
ncbi:CDP-diacylglycerol--glycerol-3-phosphate 3-phosphatidyltransferase [Mycoplasmopsis canis UFG4]|uniref:CDP-diacylglycerol--glycerol-3-phosphate 3-phosphatidyltransferase n=1 Tax=Mycoplasmopsis canis UFG4 TaxID=1131455 RepID=I1A5Q9_9BACT|nr:CDP-diacylglycerol--glycerol-3-phosphate 3-phosphatidyltransferase [Mycoplasmopsis canis]EIE40264.1 CDP-diacylglycerol--glycerol-3-phosphate 3-phosphatidyltransferase [Mycoplasmopsis canis UF33]EIE41621.1 CDP-diacylglycerol--glycerol-3-phosphate 3-phosphatidyltransferase [Mycoplasmopsis canis UFG1]EIE41830.1 CDP-diacylglycerol--glycerol-3-phosphate 3-phosphatidyltransferase [Mycoplasmopsis canis UFG4]